VGVNKPIAPIKEYMTAAPHSIGPDQPLTLAHKLMREHGCRHLPVLAGGKLIGMLTDRDLHLVETLRDVNPDKVQVEDAMSQIVYSVSPDTPLDEVTAAMAEHKYGSAVVVQNNKVIGMFTTVDACQALTELLRGRLAR